MERRIIKEEEEDLPKPILLEDLGRMFHTESSRQKNRFGLYKCGFCGTEFKANTSSVNRGKTRSCGCYGLQRIKETKTIHTLSGTRLYGIWNKMRNRVLNTKNYKYKDYGGRGITICEEWKNDPISFYKWAMSNGYSEELSIDRIDNDGNYCPENCRWTTKIIQCRNQRIRKDNTSGYRGVSFCKRNKKYHSRISIDKKRILIGRFSTAFEAGIAYNNYIIENNLEGFILNEIPDEYLNLEKETK